MNEVIEKTKPGFVVNKAVLHTDTSLKVSEWTLEKKIVVHLIDGPNMILELIDESSFAQIYEELADKDFQTTWASDIGHLL